ncbi:hypothetical protein DF051_30925 [Burkholderia contaminans]|uniref:Uncharacterized protein n=1 Tax=Burkholderia contaminans TaxID=488447 RepID=A0A3N8PBE6_9BURK|nr:hypothetical protein [Burkholderia contaminans]RQT08440.1 hypothetical protein DF051_30925 [Burkholderia contaminans]
MTTFSLSTRSDPATLHVFEQDGGWHWGITVPRSRGSGFKLVAYSETPFPEESRARDDGAQTLATISTGRNSDTDEVSNYSRHGACVQ